MTQADEFGQRADSGRLVEALRQPDTLSCGEAEVLIAMLVHAEAMGEDVDDDPVFAPVLRHLDHCADCLALYEEIAEEYAATNAQQLGPHVDAPKQTSPSQGVQQLAKPVQRRFEIVVRSTHQRREAMVREQSAPYSVQPAEPQVRLEISEGEQGATLRAVVLDPVPGETWLITVAAGSFRAEARTDATGVAIFYGVPANETVRVTGEQAVNAND